MLDDFTLYWLTNSAASSARIYWEHRGRDLPRHMAARFDSLRNDDINASGRRPLGFPYGPYLMDDLHAGSVGTLNMGRGITLEQREDGDALFQTDGHIIFDGEVQDQVHSKPLVGKPSDAPDSARKSGGGQSWACRIPRPPALLTAATRSGPVRSGPISAAMIGCSIPSTWQRVAFMNPPRG